MSMNKLSDEELKQLAWTRIFEVYSWHTLFHFDIRISKEDLVNELVRFAKRVREEENEEDDTTGSDARPSQQAFSPAE